MIVPGAKLQEIGFALYGHAWVSVLSKRLSRSKRTIMRWRDSPRGLPADTRQVLLELVDAQMAMLAEKRAILSRQRDDANVTDR